MVKKSMAVLTLAGAWFALGIVILRIEFFKAVRNHHDQVIELLLAPDQPQVLILRQAGVHGLMISGPLFFDPLPKQEGQF
jgi:hypothetical protein